MLRLLLTIISVAVCMATLTLAWTQHLELAAMHGDEFQARAESSRTISQTTPNDVTTVPEELHAPSLELLRLRGQVGQLDRRRRELDGVLTENERLRTQVADRKAGKPGSSLSSGGYLRRAEARFAGYATPEATLQTLLWALHNRDLTNILMAFTPEIAEKLTSDLQQPGRSAEDFFNGVDALIGMQVIGREESDAGIALQVEIVPGMPPETIQLRQVNGEWKMASH
jgi:hypothetical protein